MGRQPDQSLEMQAIEIVDKWHADAEHSRTVRKRPRIEIVFVVHTGPVQEYFVVRPPGVLGKRRHLAAREDLPLTIDAIEARLRTAASPQERKVRRDTERVHLLHARDV